MKPWPAVSLAALMFLLGTSFPTVVNADSGEGLSLYFAYDNPCELCNEEAEFLDFFYRTIRDIPHRPDHRYNSFNIFKSINRQNFLALCAERGINGSALSLPVLIIGDEYLEGNEAILTGTQALYLRQVEALAAVRARAPMPVQVKPETQAAAPAYSPEDPEASVLVVFVTTACENCERTRSFLEGLPRQIDLADGTRSPLILRFFNVSENEGFSAVRQFFEAYTVPEEGQLVPIVFYSRGYLSGYDAIEGELPALLASGAARSFTYPSTAAAAPVIRWLEFPAIFLAGLLGGVNPCSISMILLLLSLLASKGAHILPLGLTYVVSRMFTYLVLGLSLFSFAQVLESGAFRSLQGVVRIVAIVLAVLLCVLNLADFVNARRERYGSIKVQLPKALRRFNHGIIQRIVGGNTRFLMAALFLLGMVVSAGEFLCTGQIYLATILYLLRTHTGNFPLTLTAFLCYTTAAALPPTALVLLCHKGKQAMTLSNFFRERMPVIKLANALLFALFAVFAVFYF